MARRRTKILATIGPATSGKDGIEALLDAGADAFRLNFSHGERKDHETVYHRIREVAGRLARPVPIVQDIQGPKIRVGDLPPEGIRLADGEEILLKVGEDHDGETVPVSYQHLAEDTRPGDPVFMDDGYVQTQVLEVVDRSTVRVKVTAGGLLKRHKGVNFPGVRLSVKFPTEKDKQDLRFGQDLGVDYVAASFVRSAADVARVRAELDDRLGTQVIAKIELREALDNLEEIVRSSDAIMIARGDLGVELPPEEVPAVQKRITHLCERLGVPVITATQMLESMIVNPRPTRAEATDVYNAVLDGTSGVMLSGETAVGANPTEAVDVMARVCEQAEETLLMDDALSVRRRAVTGHTVSDALADAAVRATEDLDARAIVVLTNSGSMAKNVSKYKPSVPILAATPDPRAYHRLALIWGVTPIRIPEARTDPELLRSVEEALIRGNHAKEGDRVAVTSGRLGVTGSTNTLRLLEVGRFETASRTIS